MPGRKRREELLCGLLATYPSHIVSLFQQLYPRAGRAQQGGVCTLRDWEKNIPRQPGHTPGWDPSSGEHQAPEQSRRCCSLITPRYQRLWKRGHHCPLENALQKGLSYSVITGSGGQTPQERVHVRDFVKFAKNLVIANIFYMEGI